MISAKEALSLPSARLKPTDKEGAEKFLAEVEAYVRQNMAYNGCLIQVRLNEGQLNPPIIAEINRQLRLAGWFVQWENWLELSKLTQKGEYMGVKLALVPADNVRDEVIQK